MSHCPSCNAALTPSALANARSLLCPRCGGRAVTLGALRRIARPDRVTDLWRAAFGQREAAGAICPTCDRPMNLVALAGSDADAPPLWLDLCRPCQQVWFDGGELERMPRPPTAAPERELPAEARVALATLKAQAERERLEEELDDVQGSPGAAQSIGGWFGLPGELDEQHLAIRPVLTWGTAALIAAVSLAAFARPSLLDHWGLVPAEAMRHGGATFFTSMALHGDIFHLLGNLYFLLVFGDNVEDALGPGGWLALFLAAGLLGGLGHVALDPRAEVPVIGASGAISGLLAFYAVAFPRARVGLYFRYGWRGGWLRMRAWALFAVWCVLQVMMAYAQLVGCSPVSAIAHLGGALVGAATALWWRQREARLTRR